MAKPCAVIGATHPLGVLLTRRLVAEGRLVRALVLNAEKAKSILPPGVSMVEIEPTGNGIEDGCQGAHVIYDLFEPSGVKQGKAAKEMASAVLLAAIHNRSKVVIASHIFVSEDENRSFEKEAMSTHQSDFARVVIARIPQLDGPEVKNSQLSRVFEDVFAGNKARWTGKLDVPRSLLFIEDAVGAIQELEKNEGAYGHIWNIAGPSPMTGRRFIELAFGAEGKTGSAVTAGLGSMLTARFDSKAKGSADNPYDYNASLVIDGSLFWQAFPSFAFTPDDVGVRASLAWHARQMNRGIAGPALE